MFLGCTPKYFTIEPDDYMFKELMGVPSMVPYSKFNFTTSPKHFFKNNKLTSVLISDSSAFISENKLIYFDVEDNYFDQPSDYIYNTWFEMDAFIEEGDSGLIENKHFILRTISGRNKYESNQDTIIEGKLMYIFSGFVGPTLQYVNSNRKYSILYTTQQWKITRDKVRHKHKNKKVKKLAFIVENNIQDCKLKVISVIDIKHRRSNIIPEIYELKEIFGEPLQLNNLSCWKEY